MDEVQDMARNNAGRFSAQPVRTQAYLPEIVTG
jgi:hypothetical protein